MGDGRPDRRAMVRGGFHYYRKGAVLPVRRGERTEMMGACPLGAMVGPGCSVAQICTFYQQGDSVTFHLNLQDSRATVPNLVTIILNFVPGGASVDQSGILGVVGDLQKITPLTDAAQTLFGTQHTTVPQWCLATAKALWSLKGLNNSQERGLLEQALKDAGVSVAEGALSDALDLCYYWSIGKSVAPYVMYYATTGGHTIDCTAVANPGSGTGQSGALPTFALPVTATSPAPAQTAVTWTTTPSPTDWTINYNVTNQGSAPVWNFTVFYEPSVGAPLAVTAPTGWTYEVDSVGGTVTWYSQGPGGWINGDFGTTAIQPSASLPGFTIRHTSPPDYSLSCATDANYATDYEPVAVPAPAQGIASAKLGTEGIQEVINDGIVTAILPNNVYYVEDSNRACGIRVSGGSTPNVGDKVRIAGTITAQTGEAQIIPTACVKSGTGSVRPLGLPNKLLGGGASDVQPGVISGSGLNNIGLLVRTWGKITYVDPAETFAYVDDGLMLSDGNTLGSGSSSVTGVRIILPGGVVMPPVGSFVILTGVSSCTMINGGLVRALCIRNQGDISTAWLPPCRSVSGNVTLQDYLAPVALVPVSVQLRLHGGSTSTTTINLNSAGNYTISNVAPGVYDFAFKASHWLQKVVQNVTVSGDAFGVNASLLNGDINGDNVINISDFSAMFGQLGNAG